MPFGTFTTLRPRYKDSNAHIRDLSVRNPIEEMLPKKKESSRKIHNVFGQKFTSITPTKKLRYVDL
jgi:hypothetical protein